MTNAGPDEATLHVLPTLWFRNAWAWGRGHPVRSCASTAARMVATHWRSGTYHLDPASAARRHLPDPAVLRQRDQRRNGSSALDDTAPTFPKDGINDHVRLRRADASTPSTAGTKAAWWYRLRWSPARPRVRLRLWKSPETAATRQALTGDFDESVRPARRRPTSSTAIWPPDNCPRRAARDAAGVRRA